MAIYAQIDDGYLLSFCLSRWMPVPETSAAAAQAAAAGAASTFINAARL
jgi:hypothetical protein